VTGSRRKHIEWSVRAARDVLAIDSYLAAQNPNAANEVVKWTLERAEQFARFPFPGAFVVFGIPAQGRPDTLSLQRALSGDRDQSPDRARTPSSAARALMN